MLVKFFHFLGELANQDPYIKKHIDVGYNYGIGFSDGFEAGFKEGRRRLAKEVLQQLDEFVPDECCIKKEQG